MWGNKNFKFKKQIGKPAFRLSLLTSFSMGLSSLTYLSIAFAQSLPPIRMPDPVSVAITTKTQSTQPALDDIIPPPPGNSGLVRDLQLEVFINGRATNLIAAFRQEADDSLFIAADELRNVGINPASQALRPDGLVALGRLPEVTYELDEATQTIWFVADFAALSTRIISAHEPKPALHEASSDTGALVNYTFYGSTGGTKIDKIWGFEGVSGWFEGRFFNPFGILSHSQIVSHSPNKAYGTTRLDTSWSYSDPKSMMTYHAGDMITGGLSWTRPIRLGGIQVRRNFSLRPDLITMPLPTLTGSAAVPSTVDVYVNNTRRLSQEIEQGPFQITDLPVITGGGTARMVVRDALGRETISETPFFASTSLLAPGLWDFSAETGFARRFYAIESNNYDKRLMASATLRYGLGKHMTLEAHAEGGGGLLNGGTGAVFSLANHGVGSIAAAASSHDGRSGYQLAASLDLRLGEFHLHGRTQRSYGDYLDIAAITAESSFLSALELLTAAPPRSLDQISLSIPLKFDPSIFNISYTQFETAQGERSRIMGLSYNRPVGSRASLFATAFKDFDNKGSFGVFAGLSMRLSDDIHSAVGISSGPQGTSFAADISKSSGDETGSFGWHIRNSEGASTSRQAAFTYRASNARFEAGVAQYENSFQANAQIDGAVILVGGDIFLSNRINDAFAIVDAGAPDIDVKYENRPVGKTSSKGKLLLANMRSYEPNKVTIDPSNLPVDAMLNSTSETVVPADRSGMVIKFDVDANPQAALVILRNEDGSFIEPGSSGKLDGSSEDFVIGYDGQAYIAGLARNNSVTIEQPATGHCRAEFIFHPAKGEQVTIADVICRKVL